MWIIKGIASKGEYTMLMCQNIQNMKTKARVILTTACRRKCKNCANTQKKVMSSIKNLYSVEELYRFDKIIITGGEPMLIPDKVVKFITLMKEQKPNRKVFIYSADVPKIADLKRVVDLVDGLHYTIHVPESKDDIYLFNAVQSMLSCFTNTDKSFRLYIQQGVGRQINLWPQVWSRVEMKPWLEDCPLPEGEELFLWKGKL